MPSPGSTPASERGGDLTDGTARGDGTPERVRTGLQRQVLELDLDGDGPGRGGRPSEHRGHRLGHAQHVALELVRVDQVLAEGLLVADRLVRPVRVDRVGILAAGQGRQMGAAGLAEAAHQGVDRDAGQITDAAHAEVVQALRRRRTHAPERLDVVPVQELELDVRLDEVDTGSRFEAAAARPRLRGTRRQLGDHLGAADPHRAAQTELVAHPPAQSVGDAVGRPEQAPRAGDVHEGLVEADGLHGRGDVVEDLVQLPAHLGVAAVAPGQEDGLGAELAGPHRRHGRVHPEGPCLVGARGHDAPGAGTTHDHGFAGEGRVVEHLDRREERVHVDVEDGRDGRPLTHRGSTGGSPRRSRRRPSGPPPRHVVAPPRRPSRPGRRIASGGIRPQPP